MKKENGNVVVKGVVESKIVFSKRPTPVMERGGKV